MQLTILEQVPLESVPSASGIAVQGKLRYAIGDDSPFLHELDAGLKPLRKIRLSASDDIENGRIKKSRKADLEAMELINGNEIVVFGSGSRSPQRDLFISIELGDNPNILTYAITEFYAELKALLAMQDSELNIEAAAFHDGKMLLFNRREPVIFEFDHEAFMCYLDHDGPMPQIEAYVVPIPDLGGVASGFSGATVSERTGRLIVTSSVEVTDNAYDDGKVLGSFIGWVPIDQLHRSTSYQFIQIEHEGVPLKVESVAIEQELSDEEVQLLLTTDSDGGISTAIRCRLRW